MTASTEIEPGMIVMSTSSVSPLRVTRIVELMMRRVREQISTHEVAIELSDAAKELLVEKGYDPAMGARPLRRAIQRYIEDPLADFVLGSDLKPGVTIVVDRKAEGDEDVSITLAGGRKREKVTVPATPDETPEDEPADSSDD